MSYQHQQLAAGLWTKMTLFEQMANIGSEVGRAIKWKEKQNKEYSRLAFERALELLAFTITDNKNINRLREITRLREVMIDYFEFDNEYNSTKESWDKYFCSFNYASRLGR